MRAADDPVKTIKLIALSVGAAFAALSAHAQAFQNLNFESANLPPATPEQGPNYVSIGSALPDWTGYIGTVQQTQVEYNFTTLGTASVGLLGPDWGQAQSETGYGILDGSYTAILQTGLYTSEYGVNASIAQNGTIPGNAQSLQFEAADETSALSVSFAGNNLTMSAWSTGLFPSGLSYTVYAVDIGPYAGQTGQLEFTEVFDGYYPSVELDDIRFSTTPVPEPGIVALTAMGGLLFGARKWFARR